MHYNRAGVSNLLARHYRWGYSALGSKAETSAARAAWAYRYPVLLVLSALPLSPALAVYVTWQWVRSGIWQPLLWFPVILVTRVVWAWGMTVGGIRWLLSRSNPRWNPV